MSPQRQQALAASAIPNENNARVKGIEFSMPQDPNAELRLKVWQERPLSLYTYAQLSGAKSPLGLDFLFTEMIILLLVIYCPLPIHMS